MKAGIADHFEQLTHDIGQLVMPEADEEQVRNKASRSRRFNGETNSRLINFSLPTSLGTRGIGMGHGCRNSRRVHWAMLSRTAAVLETSRDSSGIL